MRMHRLVNLLKKNFNYIAVKDTCWMVVCCEFVSVMDGYIGFTEGTKGDV